MLMLLMQHLLTAGTYVGSTDVLIHLKNIILHITESIKSAFDWRLQRHLKSFYGQNVNANFLSDKVH